MAALILAMDDDLGNHAKRRRITKKMSFHIRHDPEVGGVRVEGLPFPVLVKKMENVCTEEQIRILINNDMGNRFEIVRSERTGEEYVITLFKPDNPDKDKQRRGDGSDPATWGQGSASSGKGKDNDSDPPWRKGKGEGEHKYHPY